MKQSLSRFICTVWLLLFSGIFVFAVPNVESPGPTLAFGYDGQVASIAYDQTMLQAFDYVTLEDAYK